MRNLINSFLVVAGLFLSLNMFAQKFSSGSLIIKTAPSKHEGRIRVLSIENKHDTTVEVLLVNEYDDGRTRTTIRKGGKYTGDATLNLIKAKAVNESQEIEILRVSTPTSAISMQKEKTEENQKNVSSQPAFTTTRQEETQNYPIRQIVDRFEDYASSLPSLSDSKIREDSAAIAKHFEVLALTSTDKKAYIEEQKLPDYVEKYSAYMKLLRDSIPVFLNDFVESNHMEETELSDSCKNEMRLILETRIDALEQQISDLREIVIDNSKGETQTNWKIIAVSIVAVLLCISLFVWYRKTDRNQNSTSKNPRSVKSESEDTPSLIVIGETKSPALKKQSLEDVYDNDAYLHIPSIEFCADSGVHTLHIKNSCIKDIYNMYADDLRNPNNPKEDGCMVLGRWVKDETTQLYDVSLESIIQPGDDAVFSEYELNFGGKIKLKVSEKLRRLRRETGLQYDLTCWVHSHPGLGVFFSNSDSNVHMQLKHPTHPKFLTALVIDILTPTQEMGIFTFKQDEEINSKNDITKMYSLEDMYKWALDSERRSFDANDYYNCLHEVTAHLDTCQGLQLSNSAIIDMTFMASNQNGFIGFAQGYTIEKGNKVHCIIETVSKSESVPNCEKIGCFVVASHCSIPSIRKTVGRYLNSISFVLVYTASDGLLTSIPVIDQDLCASEEYYGEQKLEELKIWTRRRR